MTVCNLCGYDNEKPIGRVAEDSKEGEDVAVTLNDNGLKAMFCLKGHMKDKMKKTRISL